MSLGRGGPCWPEGGPRRRQRVGLCLMELWLELRLGPVLPPLPVTAVPCRPVGELALPALSRNPPKSEPAQLDRGWLQVCEIEGLQGGAQRGRLWADMGLGGACAPLLPVTSAPPSHQVRVAQTSASDYGSVMGLVPRMQPMARVRLLELKNIF